jgi:phosphohistidine phosphatase
MKHLTLLRHAKSSWDKPGVNDFDRPLNKRGRQAAALMGAYIRKNNITPEHVLCSSAVRTRQTLSLILPSLDSDPVITFRDRLYLASPSQMLAQISSIPDQVSHLLVIGHNPGTHMLALDLVDPAQSNAQMTGRLAEKFPTAALAHFQFDTAAWNSVTSGGGALKAFVTPRSL